VLSGLYWYQQLGLSSLARGSGFLKALSPRLAQMEALLPSVPPPRDRRPLTELTSAIRTRRGRVGLLTGCAQRYLLPGLNRATVRVLARAGYDVVAPRAQGCCGALHAHSGELDEARKMARALIETFEGAGAEIVVANAAGCGAAMKDYGYLLRDDPAWRERAEAFSGRVRDVSEVLADAAWDGELKAVPVSVSYHEACHLAHGQRIRSEPRAILRQIPKLRLVELAESDLCCGSAGTYNLLQPEMANRLLARKVDRIRQADTDFVAAGNIGCLLQIQLGLRQAGSRTRAVHPVELLDWSLHGGLQRRGGD
jgi:glycolate oxidase iron-sulfur subunit